MGPRQLWDTGSRVSAGTPLPIDRRRPILFRENGKPIEIAPFEWTRLAHTGQARGLGAPRRPAATQPALAMARSPGWLVAGDDPETTPLARI